MQSIKRCELCQVLQLS